MTPPSPAARIPAFLRRFPGAVVRLSPGGVVQGSNGRLERELGLALLGRPFSEALDAESSGWKWERILREAPRTADGEDAVWELILGGPETPLEPRAFSVLWDDDTESLWLLEHRSDPRLDGLREQVTEVNSELANTQRRLVKERGRLAGALEALRARGAELERSNRALDEFAHVVSHDLKAPLRGIANYAAWLEEDLGRSLPPESREHLRLLRDRVERMRAMIQGVLEYARAGRVRAQPEAVDTGELVRDVVALLDPPPATVVEVQPGLPRLVTERAPLQQVLLNLLGNAVRYADPERPRVRVGAREREGLHEFSVADNGPGIPPNLQPRIWTLFQTLNPGSGADGTGIGLAVVKRLVEAQGGRVWVESEPGEGATFRFLWPAGGARPGEREP